MRYVGCLCKYIRVIFCTTGDVYADYLTDIYNMVMPKEREVAHEVDRWTQGFMNDLVNMGLNSEKLWNAFGIDDDIIVSQYIVF